MYTIYTRIINITLKPDVLIKQDLTKGPPSQMSLPRGSSSGTWQCALLAKCRCTDVGRQVDLGKVMQIVIFLNC